ncbi:MAG: hypothetical protein ACOC1K_07015, partial [Nanoarchaeota archaeon]
MNEEKIMIEKMLEEGKINEKEAEELLAALNESYGIVDNQENLQKNEPEQKKAEQTDKEGNIQDNNKPFQASINTKKLKSDIKKSIQENIDKEKIKEEIKHNTEKIKKEINERTSKTKHNVNEKIEQVKKKNMSIFDAISGLFNNFFGGYKYSFTEEYTGSFTAAIPFVNIENTNGSINVKNWDEAEYKMIVEYNINAEDEEKAKEIQKAD